VHRMHGAPENALLIIRKLTSRGFEGPRNVGLRMMRSVSNVICLELSRLEELGAGSKAATTYLEFPLRGFPRSGFAGTLIRFSVTKTALSWELQYRGEKHLRVGGVSGV